MRKNKFVFYQILFCISTLFIGVGYAAINYISLNISGSLMASQWDGVFITDIVYNSSINADVDASNINRYYETNMSSYIKLTNNIDSEITYTVSIYNSTDVTYFFDGVFFLEMEDGSTYSNSNITYKLDNLKKDDALHGKDTIIFDITFYYLDSTKITETDLTSLINFKFSSLYPNGQPVYFDVSKGARCTMSEYVLSWDDSTGDYQNSLTGYNGLNGTGNQNSCLLFYAFNDVGDETVNLILDHNVKAATYWTNSSTSSNQNGPQTVLSDLKSATSSWNGTLELEDYTVLQTGYGKYTIPYKTEGYKARLITAQEVAKVVGADIKEGLLFNENSPASLKYFFFDSLSSTASSTCKSGNITGCKYGWLYDRTREDCESYGCLNNCEADTYGYWTGTSSYGYSSQAWSVDRDGSLYSSSVNKNCCEGVRPVIKVLRSDIYRGQLPVKS